MKNNRIRAITFAAAVCTLLCACGENTATTPEKATEPTSAAGETEVITEEAKYHDNLGTFNFEGRDFRIIAYESDNCQAIHVPEKMNAEIINDTMYELNRKLETRFNIKFVETLDYWLTDNLFLDNVLAGDDFCEVAFTSDIRSPNLASNGAIRTYDEIGYIDLSQPYWEHNLNDKVTIAGKQFFVMGGIDLTHLDFTHMMIFSKPMVESYQLDDPYEMVRKGTWTMDAMETMMKAVVNNPDMKAEEETDIWGYAATYKEVLPNFWMSCNTLSIDKDENDIPYFAVDGNETFINVLDRVYSMMWDEQLWYFTEENANVVSNLINLWQGKRILFADTTFHYIQTLRNSDCDFGIIPYPKWDEGQENYLSRVEGGVRAAVVPITTEDTDFVGVIMEAMSCENYNKLLPVYYEKGLVDKNTRDTESEEMLNIIYNSRTYDLGDTVWNAEIREGKYAELFKRNARKFTSGYTMIINKINDKINSILEGLTKD